MRIVLAVALLVGVAIYVRWRIQSDAMAWFSGLVLDFKVDVKNRFDPEISGEEAVRRTAQTLGWRAEELNSYARARVRGTHIRVELPRWKDEDYTDEVKRVLERSGRLDFKLADDDSDYMKRISEKVPPGGAVRANVDNYDGVTRGPILDYYLIASRRSAIERFLASLPREDRVPDTHQILFAESRARDAKGLELPETEWRTYYVKRRIELSGESITDATVHWDQQTRRPDVSITLDAEGASRFESLTARSIGHRLVIVVEGKVNSAPVIQDRIPGGRVRITMGGFRDPQSMLTEANELAAVLRTGALAAPVSLVDRRVQKPHP